MVKNLWMLPFEEVMAYCKKYKDAEVDKWHFDFSNADIIKIPTLFK